MDDLVTIAKSVIETGQSDRSRQWWLARMDHLAEKHRQPGQTKEQSFAKLCDNDPVFKACYAASKIARHHPFGEHTIAKSADDVPDTISMRLTKQALVLMESSPHLSQQEAFESVVKRNPEAAAIARSEIAKSSPSAFERAATASDNTSPCAERLKNLAQSMARTNPSLDLRTAFQIVATSNPELAAAARKEIDARRAVEGLPTENIGEPDVDDKQMGKRFTGEERVEIRKETQDVRFDKVSSDARDRLVAICQRLQANGMDGVLAWQTSLQRNPELADMMPDKMASIMPSELKTYA